MVGNYTTIMAPHMVHGPAERVLLQHCRWSSTFTFATTCMSKFSMFQKICFHLSVLVIDIPDTLKPTCPRSIEAGAWCQVTSAPHNLCK